MGKRKTSSHDLTRRVAAGIICISITVLTSLLFMANPKLIIPGQRWFHHSLFLLVFFCISGCMVAFGRKTTIKLVFLSIQLGIIWVTGIPYSNPFLISVYLICAVIAESSLIFPSYVTFLVSLLSLVLILTPTHEIIAFGSIIQPASVELQILFIITILGFAILSTVLEQVYFRATETKHIHLQLEAAMSRLVETNIQLQDYVSVAEKQAMDEERKRIARDVHDILGHTLTTVNMALQAAIGTLEKNSELSHLTVMLSGARQHVKEGMLELRHALDTLAEHTPFVEYDYNKILNLANSVAQATGIEIDVEFGNTSGFQNQAQAVAVYRLIQEGITNAIRHGNASTVRIHFQNVANALMIYISDTGRGIDSKGPGFGIQSMQKRISEMDGTMTLKPNFPHGTTLHIKIPHVRKD